MTFRFCMTFVTLMARSCRRHEKDRPSDYQCARQQEGKDRAAAHTNADIIALFPMAVPRDLAYVK